MLGKAVADRGDLHYSLRLWAARAYVVIPLRSRRSLQTFGVSGKEVDRMIAGAAGSQWFVVVAEAPARRAPFV
jgi:hypothetical protein